RGAVPGNVVGLLGNFLDELRPDFFPGVLELDLLGDRDTVVGDGRRAPLFLEHDVTASRAQRHLDSVGEGVQPAFKSTAGILVERDLFGHYGVVLRYSALLPPHITQLCVTRQQDTSSARPGAR